MAKSPRKKSRKTTVKEGQTGLSKWLAKSLASKNPHCAQAFATLVSTFLATTFCHYFWHQCVADFFCRKFFAISFLTRSLPLARSIAVCAAPLGFVAIHYDPLRFRCGSLEVHRGRCIAIHCDPYAVRAAPLRQRLGSRRPRQSPV